jgi:hypothetical protein
MPLASLGVAQLQKIGLVCSNCQTEVLIDMDDAKATFPQRCPACGSDGGIYTGSNWLVQFRKIKEMKEAPYLKLYYPRSEIV